MKEASRMANADKFIANLPMGYQTTVGERGIQLSGGQKQRIAIARALVKNPQILLLDEATSALDVESEYWVQDALEKAKMGRTTIIIAHRLSTIKNADKIIAIKNGKVEEIGIHKNLMDKQGLYFSLVNSQVFADIEDARARSESIISARSRRATSASAQKHQNLNENGDEKDVINKKDPKSKLKRLQKDMISEGAKPRNLFAILKYAKPEIPIIIFGLIAAIIEGTIFPAFSLFFTNILETFSGTDTIQIKKDGHFWAMMFLILGIVMSVSICFEALLFGIAAERLTMRIRLKLFKNILRQDISYFDMPNHSSGKLCTRLASDIPNIKSAIDYRLSSIFSAFISIGSGIIIAFYFNWQMALLVVAIFPLAAIGESFQLKYAKGRAIEDAREMENAGKVALEAIENIRTIHALSLEQNFFSKFENHLEFPHRTSIRKAILQGLTYGFASSIFYFLYAAAFRFGVWLITSNYHTSHEILPMNVLRTLYAISFTAGSMGFASSYFPEYIKAKIAAGLIFKMLEQTPSIDDSKIVTDNFDHDIQGHIKLEGISFAYPQRPDAQVLNNINVEVKPGETIAFVGASGCGKSTIVSLLERFYQPKRGSIFVDGKLIEDYKLKDIRSKMALVSQEPILFDRTIRENIFYGLPESEKSEELLIEASKMANIHNFISDLPKKYDTKVGEKGTQLSGGQKQRIAIARALIRNPKILLLDEATSALDVENELLVQQALNQASQGRTCIVIAHRLATIKNANCIYVISNGTIIERGSHEELMDLKGAYYRLIQKQNAKKTC